jgi:hypothetical protein
MTLVAANRCGDWPFTLIWDHASSKLIGTGEDPEGRFDAVLERTEEVDDSTRENLLLWSCMLRIDPSFNEILAIILNDVKYSLEHGWHDREDMEISFMQALTTDGAGAVARGLSKEIAEQLAASLRGQNGADFYAQFDLEGATSARRLPPPPSRRARPRTTSPVPDSGHRVILSIRDVQERFTTALSAEIPQACLEEVHNEVMYPRKTLSIGSHVVILKTENTERYCPELIGEETEILADAQDDQPYQVQDSKCWLYASDVQAPRGPFMTCSKLHQMEACIHPASSVPCQRCEQSVAQSEDEIMVCRQCRVGVCNTCCKKEALAAVDEVISRVKRDRIESWLTQQRYEHIDSSFDSECPICCEEMVESDLVDICRGGVGRPAHTFHRACARDWLFRSNECPVCRRSPAVDYASIESSVIACDS